jgi:hypothetical protein
MWCQLYSIPHFILIFNLSSSFSNDFSYVCSVTQVAYEEELHRKGIDVEDISSGPIAAPTDLPSPMQHAIYERDYLGAPTDLLEDISQRPWGDVDVVNHILTNLGGMVREDLAIDLERGPVEGLSYLEQEATTPIYTGSSKSRLHFIIWAMALQVKHNMTNVAMDDLFRSMADNVAPQGEHIVNNMPRSRYEARKVLSTCGLDYITIDCCPCDGTIYYGEKASLLSCPFCNESRYRDDMKKVDVPRKKFHYFPLVPRLLALFRSPTFAKLMQWYALHRSEDGTLKVPADGRAFKHAEQLFKDHVGQSYDCRNVFMGLAMDGINPRGINSTGHSTWPILLVLYNLPPWMSTKAAHILLSIIIPGMHN